MNEIGRAVQRALRDNGKLKADLLQDALSTLQGYLKKNDRTSIEGFAQEMDTYFRHKLLTTDSLQGLGEKTPLADGELSEIAASFHTLMPEIGVIHPIMERHLSVKVVAFSAMGGALVGQLLMEPLTRYLLGKPDLGMVIGPLVGAYLGVLLINFLPSNTTARRLLTFLLGGAVAGEIISGAVNFGNRGFLRRLFGISKNIGFFRRVLVYLILGLFLVGSKKQTRMNVTQTELFAQIKLETWLTQAIILLTVLRTRNGDKTELNPKMHQTITILAEKIQKLYLSSAEDLDVAGLELIDSARGLGFEGIEGAPTFQTGTSVRRELAWDDILSAEYDTFGHIVQGDAVRIVREPVLWEGLLLSRGLVRKIREGNG